MPTSVGVGLGCGVTSPPSLGRGGVARLPAGRPVHACTSAQHRMHAAVEVAASIHRKAVRALLLVARETHPGNEGGTSFAAGVLDHKYSLSHEEPGAHLGDAKACSE